MTNNSEVLSALSRLYAHRKLLVDPKDTLAFRSESVYKNTTEAIAVVFPETTEQIEQTVQLARQHHIALIPQGGNTNRCIGAIPPKHKAGLVINMKLMNKVESFSENLDSITLQAGVLLGQAQKAALEKNRLIGVDIGARDSCMIGGNIATNAGGMQSLRYGNMRAQVLGLEVVTGAGQTLSMMSGLLKNNTGYDLMHLFIGAEGTLGIISRAILKLHPNPPDKQTVVLCCATPKASVEILQSAQSGFADSLMRFEFIEQAAWQAMCETPHAPKSPIRQAYPVILLLEISHLPDSEKLIAWLAKLSEIDLIEDAILPQSQAQADTFWNIRDRAAFISRNKGNIIRHDIAFLPEKIPQFLTSCKQKLQKHHPKAVPIAFGHFGDGNIHYNVLYDKAYADGEQLRKIVLDMVRDFGGTFSAEHGIGEAKLSSMTHYKEAKMLQVMREIKSVFDPQDICNPGKLLPK